MTRAHHNRVRVVLSAWMLGFGLTVLYSNLVLAETVLGPNGGPGGNSFRFDCPKGAYLVGFQGKAGEWIDRLQPLCAPWMHNANIFGPFSVGPTYGDSRGGRTFFKNCNDNRVKNRAIPGVFVEFLRTDSKLLGRVSADCITVGPPGPHTAFEFGNKEKKFMGSYASQVCPLGEVATGIHGRKGLFIDAIGLICSPFPPKAPKQFETGVNPNAIAPPPPPSPFAPPPAPSSSATTQMKRSPSLVMPRGVEEKGAPEGNQPVSTTPEPEKKP